MRLEKYHPFYFWLLLTLIPNRLVAADLTVNVVDTSGAPITDAVVYAEPQLKPISKSSGTVMIEQKKKTFIPMVTAIQTGTSINFPNRDLVRHHVYSFSPAKTFEIKLYSGIPANPILFDAPGTVVLGCNIHDTMQAYIHIVDTPYFAKTDSLGKARLTEVPPGEYRLKVWYYATIIENLITEKTLSVKNSETAEFTLEIKKP